MGGHPHVGMPSSAQEADIAEAMARRAAEQARLKAETDEAAARAAGPPAEAARSQEVLSEQEKVAERRKPADAARYQAEQEADARRIALVKQAEADAQRSRLTGEGEKAHRAALADAVRIEGEAEAAAIGARGAAEVSEPLSAIDKMKVISTDGASRLSRTVADNVAKGVELLGCSTTGVDLAELLKNLTQGRGSDSQPVTMSPTTAPAEANGKIDVTG